MNDNILEINEVSKQFTDHKALDAVSFDVPRGTVYGLLGPNGAGKTTLIRIINHITAPDSGSVTFDGHPLQADDVAHIGYLPEERGLYKKMKVGDQAVFFARLKGLSRTEAERELRKWFERFDIASWWGRKVEELSKGMAQKVQFIVTVLHRPKLLIFDEPFSGFDPVNAALLRDEILRLRQEGSTVVFSTHNMASVEEICSHITLINKGHNILTGRVDDIRARFSDGRYQLTYNGDSAILQAALEPLVTEFTERPADRGRLQAEVLLRPDAQLSRVIEAANGAVGLVGFNEVIASMDNVFIRTVGSDSRELATKFQENE